MLHLLFFWRFESIKSQAEEKNGKIVNRKKSIRKKKKIKLNFNKALVCSNLP